MAVLWEDPNPATLVSTGEFRKEFYSFWEGLEGLTGVSTSAAQALRHQDGVNPLSLPKVLVVEGVEYSGEGAMRVKVMQTLVANAFHDGQLDSKCCLVVRGHTVRYCTVSGLVFSFWFSFPRNVWTFSVVHPRGKEIPSDSTLRASALGAGWIERMERKEEEE